MTRPLFPDEASDSRDPYVAPRPRASDAIGKALRGAFDADRIVPCDIAGALHRLDHVPG